MDRESLRGMLSGNDLRSTGNSDEVAALIKSQDQFDELFPLMGHPDKVVSMRASDAVEKVTTNFPQFLVPHKPMLFELMDSATRNVVKWHLAQLVTRIELDESEFARVWQKLYEWAADKKESRIVRVFSITSMFEMLQQYPDLQREFDLLISEMETEGIPSINARLRLLRKKRRRFSK